MSDTIQARLERLTAIQAVLGLSTLDFAQVLGLARPGPYKRLDASKDMKPHEANRERLAVVERIAIYGGFACFNVSRTGRPVASTLAASRI